MSAIEKRERERKRVCERGKRDKSGRKREKRIRMTEKTKRGNKNEERGGDVCVCERERERMVIGKILPKFETLRIKIAEKREPFRFLFFFSSLSFLKKNLSFFFLVYHSG